MAPALPADDAQVRLGGDALDAIRWRDDLARRAVVVHVGTLQRHNRAVFVELHVGHQPPLPAIANAIANTKPIDRGLQKFHRLLALRIASAATLRFEVTK